ncbi:MAG: hypothetical protein FJ086_06635 [Deltaproteobacteria bacterium]|nr:hypothetical protein [Deltaproteobacteria bacterium]
MSFLSNVTNALSNPFVRQIAGGIGGLAKGAEGVNAVNKGFQLFDQLISSFGKGPATTSTDANTQAPTGLADPRDVLDFGDGAEDFGTDFNAATQQVGTARNAATAGGGFGSIIESGLSGFGSGSGLSSWQNNLLSKIDDPKQRELQKMQMIISNMTNLLQAISNISKMIAEAQKGIIQNIRA